VVDHRACGAGAGAFHDAVEVLNQGEIEFRRTPVKGHSHHGGGETNFSPHFRNPDFVIPAILPKIRRQSSCPATTALRRGVLRVFLNREDQKQKTMA
jgi:hypothetical protein